MLPLRPQTPETERTAVLNPLTPTGLASLGGHAPTVLKQALRLVLLTCLFEMLETGFSLPAFGFAKSRVWLTNLMEAIFMENIGKPCSRTFLVPASSCPWQLSRCLGLDCSLR